jgi:hypothetical protein
MGKIGTYDYPETRIKTLIEGIEILVKTFHGQVSKDKTFSDALGHSSERSGGFLVKLTDMRKYGFVEKRGVIATPRAKRIIQPLNQEERQTELSKAISDIPLWMALYNKIKSKQPNSQDFKLHLQDLTSDRDSVVKKGNKILNLYKDAMNYYTAEGANKNSDLSEGGNDMQIPQESISPLPLKGEASYKIGDVKIIMPKTQKALKLLERMVDIIKEDIQTDEPDQRENS